MVKLRVGQEAYHLSGVAESLDAYYTGAGEAHGVWVGGSAQRLGLTGDVEPHDLRAVLAGLAPGRGGLTPNGEAPRSHPRRVPGFDLTFRPAKSASVLYAVSDDPRVQAAVIEAGERAMRASIGWLEREVIRVDRGSHNRAWIAKHADELEPGQQPRRLESSGVVAASFRHRTSRSGDPLLHWHVLVANLVEGADGRWSAFVHPELFRHQKAAGQVFQAVFRDELTHTLGVEWRPGRTFPEIAGIPQVLLDRFSKRSAEIDAWLEGTGTPDTPEGRQTAVLATRRHKGEVEHERFDSAWKLEAIEHGWGPEHAADLVTEASLRLPDGGGYDDTWRLDADLPGPNGTTIRHERLVDPEEWIADLLRRHLTAESTTFTYAGLTAAVAARQGDGASIDTIERITNRVLASAQVLPIDTDGAERWTSTEIVGIEARFIAALHTTTPTAAAAADAVGAAIAARPTLGDDQRAAVEVLCGSTAGVGVLVGPAGTGKTYTLDTIRDALSRAGIDVIGAAPSARAARELAAGANLPASTLHSLLDRWDRGFDAPTGGSMLIVDEAGMADIRILERAVTRQLAAGGRVLLVGDHHQLPEVGAGGGFAYAATHAPTVAELTVNRRQRQPWEQDALTELRNGSVAAAVDAYLTHQRVIITDTPTDMIDTAVDRWLTARNTGHHLVLLAGTTNLVNALNTAVIARLSELGELDPTADTTSLGDREVRVGERVVLRRNTIEHTTTGHSVEVNNGQLGTITNIEPGAVTVQVDAGDEIQLGDRYLARGGRIDHAYALTSHRAQGGTWDLAIAVGADGLYREGAYVELSRGIHENWIILTSPEAAELARQHAIETERHDTGLTPPDDRSGEIDEELINRMSRSRAKTLAHGHDPDVRIIDYLATTRPLTDLITDSRRALTAERHATEQIGASADTLEAMLERYGQVAARIEIGMQISPSDRHNIGTVTNLDDTTGTATLQFVSADGHEAERDFHWSELRLVHPDQHPTHELTPAAAAHVAEYTATVRDRIDEWTGLIAAEGFQPGDAVRYQRAGHLAVEREAHALGADRLEWLANLIAGRPYDPAGARAWDDAVTDIARWRLLHDNIDTALEPEGRQAWDTLAGRLVETREWLDTTDRLTPANLPTRTEPELAARLTELDELFATAPADWRRVIQAIQDGQLTLDDTLDLLREAAAGQDARHAWIIRNWPHVVEHHEINRALDDLAVIEHEVTGQVGLDF